MRKPHSFIRKFRRKPLLRHRVHLSSQENSPLFRSKSRARLTSSDRLFFVQLYRWFPSILQVIHIIRPETLIRWHRTGFRSYWRYRGGRPQVDTELRALIAQMSFENPLWGAPRIHGEL